MQTRREEKEFEQVHNMAIRGGSTEEIDFIHALQYSYGNTHCCPLLQCLVPPQSAVRSGGCQTEGGSPVEGEGREEWSGEEVRS